MKISFDQLKTIIKEQILAVKSLNESQFIHNIALLFKDFQGHELETNNSFINQSFYIPV